MQQMLHDYSGRTLSNTFLKNLNAEWEKFLTEEKSVITPGFLYGSRTEVCGLTKSETP
jgi:hypothetical protein